MISLRTQPPLTVLLAIAGATGFLAFLATLLPSFVIVAPVKAALPSDRPLQLTLENTPQSHYADMTARPLFSEGRRPGASPSKEAALPPLDNYRLVGILTKPGFALALVERKTTKEIVSLKAGDNLDGRSVVQVDVSGVSLSGGGDSEKLVIPKAQNAAPNLSETAASQLPVDPQ